MHEIVIGLGFGDESKGATVDWLCATRDINAVIRFNGGAQAAHNVVQPDGRHHTFAQFGSGTFHGVPTHLSQFVLVNPFNLVREARHLEELGCGDVLENNLTIAEGALLVTPYHVAANRTRETIRGAGRHGSTGQGIGETRAYALTYGDDAPLVGDLWRPSILHDKLNKLLARLYDELPLPNDLMSPVDLVEEYRDLVDGELLHIVPDDYIYELLDAGDCVFEGAQGVLLDEDLGFHPHTTWTCTTQKNARTLLAGRPAHVYGLTRMYHTRHGAGPMPTESRIVNGDVWFPEPHNGTGEFQGSWRVGELDLTLLDYAIRANGGVDEIVVSHCDLLGTVMYECTYGYDAYEHGTFERLDLPSSMEEQAKLTGILQLARPLAYDLVETEENLANAIEDVTRIRPTVFSYGPTWQDKRVVRFVDERKTEGTRRRDAAQLRLP